MALTPGTRLGPFEVMAPLGAGGMGEVYQARDTKLGRDVALKVLPEAFTRDAHRLVRFEREARILAALDHPNIAVIHGLEESDGVRILEMELVRGQTLAERIASGPLTLDEALPIFGQIAAALEAAHEKGIVHRDLKPANVKVTPEGKVKVLDFGLAKDSWTESLSGDPSSSPTAALEGSIEGTILGSANYMSPEQARGRSVDKRADVWAFGCVLFEALTGRKVFPGETVSDAIVALLSREPDWGALPGGVPPRIRTLLRRCLHKEAAHRLRDIGDARLEIEEATGESARGGEATGAALPARSPRRWRMPAIALASVLVGVVVGALALRTLRPSEGAGPRVVRLARLTNDPGFSESPTWGPDGNLLAFASNRSGNYEVYVRQVEGGQEVNVTDHPAEDFQPAFSPDGKWIAFVSTRSSRSGMIPIMGQAGGADISVHGGDLWVAPALGGSARRVAMDANYPAWHSDGLRIAYVSGPSGDRSILEVGVDGDTPRTLLPNSASHRDITRLSYGPGGAWLSFENTDQRIFVLPLAGGPPRELLLGSPRVSNHVWGTGGGLYFLTRNPQGGTRLQVAVMDERRGQPRGEPRTVALVTAMLRDLSLSRDGRCLAVSELELSLNLSRLPLAGSGQAAGPEELLHPGRVVDHNPAFSPDGRQVAFQSDRLGPLDTWILDLTNRRLERLRLPGAERDASAPRWFPDGRQLLVKRGSSEGMISFWRVALDGSAAESLPLPEGRQPLQAAISSDGRRLLYYAPVGGFVQLFLLDLPSGRERQLTFGAVHSFDGAWSPDGRWIAYCQSDEGAVQVWRMLAEGGAAERLTSGHERIRHVFYSHDGKWIYAQPSHRNVYRLPSSGGPLQAVTRFSESGLYIDEPTLSPDGRWLAYVRSRGGSSLWLLTLGDGPQPAR